MARSVDMVLFGTLLSEEIALAMRCSFIKITATLQKELEDILAQVNPTCPTVTDENMFRCLNQALAKEVTSEEDRSLAILFLWVGVEHASHPFRRTMGASGGETEAPLVTETSDGNGKEGQGSASLDSTGNPLKGLSNQDGGQHLRKLLEEKISHTAIFSEFLSSMGPDRVWECYQEALRLDSAGTELVADGSRRKTKGGICLKLLKVSKSKRRVQVCQCCCPDYLGQETGWSFLF
jgi:hypothetical protein